MKKNFFLYGILFSHIFCYIGVVLLYVQMLNLEAQDSQILKGLKKGRGSNIPAFVV